MMPERVLTGSDPEPARRGGSVLDAVYRFLISPTLALTLLVVVLLCCLAGVTVVRARAGELIFGTLWFNGLLVLLAISSATAFFTRIWRRKLTVVQVGMILFHVSFATLLGGVVYNRLFHFEGLLRLTEGETLPNGRAESYDSVSKGRFFDFSRLRGETTLLRMHREYRVDGENKRAAYELALSDGDALVRRVIYITDYLDFEGARFFCLKEGYSVLLVAAEKGGKELFGAFLPLQSMKQADGSYLYVSGSAEGIAPFRFPPPPEHPVADLQLVFRPSTVADRQGEITIDALPFGARAPEGERSGRVVVGTPFDLGRFTLTPKEMRYWVGVIVRHDPGLTIILASLCFGALGMAVILVGRLRQPTTRRRPA